MQIDMNRTMQEAMRLMQSGDLYAATRAIQHGLGGAPTDATEKQRDSSARDAIDGQYRVEPDDEHGLSAPAFPGVPDRNPEPHERFDGTSPPRPGAPDRNPESGERSDGTSPTQPDSELREGEFRDHYFTCTAGAIHYKLFIPAGIPVAQRPLIVMLHGCTQSPDDFARGTRMNHLAQEHGYVIAYPAQSRKKNVSGCWNWFRSADQQRGQGEPAILAALAKHLVDKHALDERRVYAAGLSAGGAMAAVLANTYPDVFAAIGVHSGLPFGAAHDMPSAFAAMRGSDGTSRYGKRPIRPDRIPTIVFHGDRDMTVDPCNGSAVIAQSMATAPARAPEGDGMRSTVERGAVPGGHSYTRTIFTDATGAVVAEQWLVHGAGHAWFGGDPAGTYTDRAGPDASEQMLRFFSGCVRDAIN